MTSSVKLEHIGEALVSSMIRNSPAVQHHILDRSISAESKVICELALDKWCGRIFDGAHRVDIAIVENEICFPIELKLGRSRMSENEFTKRFLSSVSTSHGDKRIKGGMISILDRRWEGREDEPIEAKASPMNFRLVRPWSLVIRKEIAIKWANTLKPGVSQYCKIVVLEELIEKYGSPEDFNNLVSSLVTGNYHDEWIVT